MTLAASLRGGNRVTLYLPVLRNNMSIGTGYIFAFCNSIFPASADMAEPLDHASSTPVGGLMVG